MAQEGQYASDRWLTPGVVMVALVVGGLVVAVIGAGVAYLQAHGQDPDPMLKLVTTAGAAVGTLVNSVLLLAGRTTSAKIERNTGQQAAALSSVAEVIDTRIAPAVEAVTTPPAYDEAPHTAAAAPPGSYGLPAARPTIGPRR